MKLGFFSIRYKIMFFLVLLVGMTLLVSLLLFSRSADTIQYQTSVALINNLTNISNSIDIVLESLDTLMAGSNIDDSLKTWLEVDPDVDIYQWYITNYNIMKYLNSLSLGHAAIDSVYAYSFVNDVVFGTGMGRTITGESIRQNPWYALFHREGEKKWELLRNLRDLDFRNKYYISSATVIQNRGMTDDIGVITINIDERYIRRYFENIRFGESGVVYILDHQGKIISHNNRELVGEPSMTWEILRDQTNSRGSLRSTQLPGTILLYTTSRYTGWKYVAELPIKAINEPIISIRNIAFVISSIYVLFAAMMAYGISKSVVNPISQLSILMRRAGKGDLSEHRGKPRKDEFGLLYDSFNDMVSNSKNLIHELYLQKLQRKELHLKMIQSQINSHFLYNTLDAIHWTAKEHKLEDLCLMTKNLSQYFKKNLSEGKEIIPLREIYYLLESYIQIQNIRYAGRFHVRSNFDPTLLDHPVLKFIFQPIVENAFIHGGDTLKKRHHIRISCTSHSGSFLKFEVSDDGKGMDEATLKKVLNVIDNENYECEGTFALWIVNSMIRLYYGPSYGLSIQSESGKGTCVSFVLPLQHKKEDQYAEAIDC